MNVLYRSEIVPDLYTHDMDPDPYTHDMYPDLYTHDMDPDQIDLDLNTDFNRSIFLIPTAPVAALVSSEERLTDLAGTISLD